MDDIDWTKAINAKQMYNPAPAREFEPKVDALVSKVVGFTVYTTDPRLLRKVAEWKSQKVDPDEQDNFLKDPRKVEELKEALSKPL